MNILELKEYIKDLPDNMLVVHQGYKWWYDPSEWAKLISVKWNIGGLWYDWKYIDATEDEYWNYWPIVTVLKI